MDLNRTLLKEYDNKTLILYLKYLYLKLNDFIEFDVISLIENYRSYRELFENLDTDIYKKFVYLQMIRHLLMCSKCKKTHN